MDSQARNWLILDMDTIAAISTPLGEGGIGIVRLSGPQALPIAERTFRSKKGKGILKTPSHRILYGHVIDPLTGEPVDECLLSIMRAPNTYTREDMAEINCHGGSLPLRRTLELVLRAGARLAAPGEFTKRAFLNGRLDLLQSEAVLDIIHAKSEEAEKMALQQLEGGLSERIKAELDALANLCVHIEAWIDFPEEEIGSKTRNELQADMAAIRERLLSLVRTYEEGRLIREGLKTAIVGRPNVGKSSLLNALLGEERAIVTDIPGTTRDVISEYINIGGHALRIMDTAGIREGRDEAEREGVQRSLRAIGEADLVICLLDGSAPLAEEDREIVARLKDKKHIMAVNKSDISPAWETESEGLAGCLRISAKTGAGLDELKKKIKEGFFGADREVREGTIIANLRHKLALEKAITGLEEAGAAFKEDLPLEIVSLGLREALAALGEVVGSVSTEDILEKIFSQFCIGK